MSFWSWRPEWLFFLYSFAFQARHLFWFDPLLYNSYIVLSIFICSFFRYVVSTSSCLILNNLLSSCPLSFSVSCYCFSMTLSFHVFAWFWSLSSLSFVLVILLPVFCQIFVANWS